VLPTPDVTPPRVLPTPLPTPSTVLPRVSVTPETAEPRVWPIPPRIAVLGRGVSQVVWGAGWR
jgi:hypothetical protein